MWSVDSSWDDGVMHTLTLTLTSGLISRFFVSIPLYQITKPQMYLMLDQFVWEYPSRYGDISCFNFALYFYYKLCHYRSSKNAY